MGTRTSKATGKLFEEYQKGKPLTQFGPNGETTREFVDGQPVFSDFERWLVALVAVDRRVTNESEGEYSQ